MPLNISPSLPPRMPPPPSMPQSSRAGVSSSDRRSSWIKNEGTTPFGKRNQRPTTSVSDVAVNALDPHGEQDTANEDELNNARYAHSQAGLLRRGHQVHAEEIKMEKEKAADPSQFSFHAGTGHLAATTGRGSFARKLAKAVYKGRYGTFQNISDSNRKYITNLVYNHSKAHGTGVGFSYMDKKRMKTEAYQAYKEHKNNPAIPEHERISQPDIKTFYRIIDELK